jgi:hypothetical protein
MRAVLTRLSEVVTRLAGRASLVEPASPEAIASLITKYPAATPDVLEFYRITDGALLSDPWWEFESIARVLANARMLDGMIGADFGDDADWWSARWIPVGADVSGNALCVDTAGAFGGTTGQVLIFMHDEARRRVVAPSLQSYVTSLCVATEMGVLCHDDDSGFLVDGNQERWDAFLSERQSEYPFDGRV